MEQPELGRKIAELRKARGLTQEELVEKCDVSVRTLQRIESGSVIPRSYTLKSISKELGYSFYKSGGGSDIFDGLNGFMALLQSIVNFKQDTMKKVSILSSTLLIVLLGIFMINAVNVSRSETNLRKLVNQQNLNSVEWFNSGKIDQILDYYSAEACFYRAGHPSYCGKEDIYRVMQKAVDAKLFKMMSNEIISLDINGNLALEKSLTTSQAGGGAIITTINMQHWHRISGEWLIVNDIDVPLAESEPF